MRRRLLLAAALLVALVAVAAAAAGWWWSHGGAPQRSGRATLPGLAAAVDVRWDARGVPYVRARSVEDLAAALGWLHANDRLTQMELGRRLAAGRLAELVGARAVATDRAQRTLRLRPAAERLWHGAGAESRRWLAAYARGVNAWLAARGGDLPPGLRLLAGPGFRPEPWSPVDSLSFVFLMGEDLSFWAGRPEEERFLWLRELGPERTRDLLGGDPFVPPEILALAREQGPWRGPAAAPPAGSPGSNNWALGPGRTASGAPVVANDPHLPLRLPGTWYQASLRAPGYAAAGMTLPGLPGVVIGRGREVAWGLTNVMLDDHDLFFERVEAAPGGGERVRRGDGWAPVTVERETIRVRGAAPVEVELRRTDRGPLLPADELRDLPPRSLAWTLYAPGDPLSAFLALARAPGLAAVARSIGGYAGPAQNLVVADRDGGILWTVLGRVPERARGDGRLPSPGWVPAYGWRGLRDRAANPARVSPPEGLLVTANDRVAPRSYPFPLTAEYDTPHRARRIRQLLTAGGPWRVGDLPAVQGDVVSLYAREVVAGLPAAAADEPAAARRARRLLAGWDGTMASRDAAGAPLPAAALFAFLERRLREGIFGDEAAAHHLAPLADRERLLRALAGDLDPAWFDDVSTPRRETAAEVAGRALAAAWGDAVARWGEDSAHWDYEAIHTLTLRHPLGTAPLVGRLFDRGPFPVPGSATTVDAAGGRWRDGVLEVTYGPSMRWATDLGRPDATYAVLPAGQSGHPFDPHYDDQIDAYRRGAVFPFPWSDAAIDAVTVSRLSLEAHDE